MFRIKHEDEYSELKEIEAVVPQGSDLGPVLYMLYTCDPQILHCVTQKSKTIANNQRPK